MSATEQTISALTIAAAVARYEQGDAGPIRDLLQQARGDAEVTRRILREAGALGAPTFASGSGALVYEAPAGVAELRRDLERAEQTRERDLKALTRPDGKPIYSDAEDRQRRQAIETEYRRQRARVRQRAEQATELLRAAMPTAPDADRLFDNLPEAEVQRAATRLVFVQSDFAELDAEALVSRLEQVAAGDDRTLKLLYLRVGRRWLARPVAVAATDPAQQAAERSVRLAERDRIRAALDAISETFVDAGLRAILEAQLEHWATVPQGMVLSDYLAEQYRPVVR